MNIHQYVADSLECLIKRTLEETEHWKRYQYIFLLLELIIL
jgi:hypothetical protein